MAGKIYRTPHGKHFTYRYASGKTVKNKRLRKWVKELIIPPAWTEVEIDLDRNAKIHAIGRDAKNRKQYVYNKTWSDAASEQKFQRILRFGEQLETMRRVSGQHLNIRPIDEKTVLASMARMLDEAFFRPGNPHYTQMNNTYGLTTLRTRHMDIKRGCIEFDYTGKSNKDQHRVIKDEAVRDVLIELEKMTGYDLFDITLPDGSRKKLTPHDLNDYLSDIMGEDFSAKDFRTWGGTVLMAMALNELGPIEDININKSNILKCVKSVAEKLGNTPAVCRDSYVHPQVILQYEKGLTLDYFRRQLRNKTSKYLSLDEKATLKLLKL